MIRHLPRVDSTNAEAWRLLEAGEPPGFAVRADEQTAGRGREGRPFHSPAGGGLWASVTARSALPPASLPAYGVAAGVASAEALRVLSGLAVDLRWPNDLMIGTLKLGGILLESRGPLLVLGIGVNLTVESFPPDLAGIATSVRLAGGRVPGPDALLKGILAGLNGWVPDLEAGRTEGLLLRWRALCRTLGRRVRIEAGGRVLEGRLTGLDLSEIGLDTGERLAAGHVTRLVER